MDRRIPVKGTRGGVSISFRGASESVERAERNIKRDHRIGGEVIGESAVGGASQSYVHEPKELNEKGGKGHEAKKRKSKKEANHFLPANVGLRLDLRRWKGRRSEHHGDRTTMCA